MVRKISILFAACFLFLAIQAQKAEVFVDNLIAKMTLEEKIGQLNLLNGTSLATGKVTIDNEKENQIKNGQIGGLLNVIGVDQIQEFQKYALQSRLHIPLIFGLDVIHGFRTTFPVPLGETASWDLAAIEQAARIAAMESSAYGINWTYAPMVDIARDPRWGRVMEGAGEDTYLGSKVAVARVKGFQGNKLGETDAVMACVKHFAAYGAAVGGRDYNSVDMSIRQLFETYLPPFKAAIDAGAATLMNSFNDLNGVPATGNTFLVRDVLKRDWNFKGFVVSDWGSVGEQIAHGYAVDRSDAALKAITAGCDMDMESRCYRDYLKELVGKGVVKMTWIDDAVRRILLKKYELGLFSDPYRFCDRDRQKAQKDNLENRKLARQIGAKSIVLLRNQNNLLPLDKSVRKVAIIGPFAKATVANHGFWSVAFPDDSLRIVSQYDGIRKALDEDSQLFYAKGCNENDEDRSGFAEALEVAQKADVVIMSLGEGPAMSGEAKSRSNIHFSGVQEELLKEVSKTGKPIVLLINAGRPLVFDWAAENIPAILYTWWLGTEAGNSIADVVFGNYNPSGKLPMTFPRSEGQIPIYYNHYSTGRPAKDENDKIYVSSYIDLPNTPQYPFGFGLSYTSFEISNLKLSSQQMALKGGRITISVDVRNSGNRDGEEVVQLYVRDLVGCVVRPVRELKGFHKVMLKAGETKPVSFELTSSDLKFYNDKAEYIHEAGNYDLYVGNSSVGGLKGSFELK